MDRYHDDAPAKGRAMRDRHLLRIAWYCWGVPAILGVGATALHVLTREPIFIPIGLSCALVGPILFAVGLAMVGAARSGPRGALLLLLISNFPLAFACAVVGMTVDAGAVVKVAVINHSNSAIDGVDVKFGRSRVSVHPIPIGGKGSLRLITRYSDAGQLSVSVTLNGKANSIDLGRYDSDDPPNDRYDLVVTDEGIQQLK